MPPAKTTTTTEIMGGLGNQLFQIFNLMAYSFRHNTALYFSPEPIHHGIRKTTYWQTPLLEALKYFVKLVPHNNQLMMYHERNFHYEEPQPPPAALTNQTFKFFGYFQSYKYFEDQQDIIYKFIRLRETQADIREKTKQPQYGYDYANTVALHFRVGDYKNLPNHHPLMTLEYYTEALTRMGEIPPAPQAHTPSLWKIPYTPSTIKNTQSGGVGDFPHNILYFCEEADQAYVQEKMIQPLQQNPLFKNKFTFQCIDHNLSDWEQLIVMSLCRHHIIANSTFSWWGAYLGGSAPSPPHLGQADASAVSSNYDQPLPETGVWGQSPQVYYPTTWFGPAMGNKNLSDLFPTHWHRINI
jgi:hypothetical protein